MKTHEPNKINAMNADLLMKQECIGNTTKYQYNNKCYICGVEETQVAVLSQPTQWDLCFDTMKGSDDPHNGLIPGFDAFGQFFNPTNGTYLCPECRAAMYFELMQWISMGTVPIDLAFGKKYKYTNLSKCISAICDKVKQSNQIIPPYYDYLHYCTTFVDTTINTSKQYKNYTIDNPRKAMPFVKSMVDAINRDKLIEEHDDRVFQCKLKLTSTKEELTYATYWKAICNSQDTQLTTEQISKLDDEYTIKRYILELTAITSDVYYAPKVCRTIYIPVALKKKCGEGIDLFHGLNCTGNFTIQ